MNMLKYLAVGSSLDSGRDVVGRYRVREASLLPRFDPDAETGSASASRSAKMPPWWRRILNWFRPVTPSPMVVPSASNPGELTNRSEIGDLKPEPQEVSVASPTAPSGPQIGDGVGRKAQKPVQNEFRFENVMVVCNDLHDADFEIVSRPRGRRSPAKAMDQPAVVHA